MPLMLHPHATSPMIQPWIYGRWPVGCNGGAFVVYHASTVASPCHLAINLTLDLWKVACGLQWWSLCRIVCLYGCIPHATLPLIRPWIYGTYCTWKKKKKSWFTQFELRTEPN